MTVLNPGFAGYGGTNNGVNPNKLGREPSFPNPSANFGSNYRRRGLLK